MGTHPKKTRVIPRILKTTPSYGVSNAWYCQAVDAAFAQMLDDQLSVGDADQIVHGWSDDAQLAGKVIKIISNTAVPLDAEAQALGTVKLRVLVTTQTHAKDSTPSEQMELEAVVGGLLFCENLAELATDGNANIKVMSAIAREGTRQVEGDWRTFTQAVDVLVCGVN